MGSHHYRMRASYSCPSLNSSSDLFLLCLSSSSGVLVSGITLLIHLIFVGLSVEPFCFLFQFDQRFNICLGLIFPSPYFDSLAVPLRVFSVIDQWGLLVLHYVFACRVLSTIHSVQCLALAINFWNFVGLLHTTSAWVLKIELNEVDSLPVG
ncbi:unnamed protein product [Citrullus colocynthis]|uniref:Uncharacterized protein n=1 Tax=Citrullus colocynthis TaxID=252529 RepID=A0ABP0Y032_9ROSI